MAKWKAICQSHVETGIDWTSFNFQFKESNLPLKVINYCVTDQPSIALSQRSVLISNFNYFLLCCWWAALWELSGNGAKRKNSVLLNLIMCMDKNDCNQEFWYIWYSTLEPENEILAQSIEIIISNKKIICGYWLVTSLKFTNSQTRTKTVLERTGAFPYFTFLSWADAVITSPSQRPRLATGRVTVTNGYSHRMFCW